MKQILLLLISCISVAAAGQNKLPVIKAQNHAIGYGQQVCTDIQATDADNDSVFIWVVQQIPKAVFTNNNGQVLFASGSVCFTPDRSSHADTLPYPIIIYATDKKDTVSRKVYVSIHPCPHNVHPVIKKVTYNSFEIAVKGDAKEPWHRYPGLMFESKIIDENNTVVKVAYDGVFTFTAPAYQQYRLYVTFRTSTPETYVSLDTLLPDFSASVINVNTIAVQVFPNPAAHTVMLSNLPANAASIWITDISGRKLLSTDINGNAEPVSVFALPAGIYLINITDAENRVLGSAKLVKQ